MYQSLGEQRLTHFRTHSSPNSQLYTNEALPTEFTVVSPTFSFQLSMITRFTYFAITCFPRLLLPDFFVKRLYQFFSLNSTSTGNNAHLHKRKASATVGAKNSRNSVRCSFATTAAGRRSISRARAAYTRSGKVIW